MSQVRHGSATTTHAVRAAIQRSQVSLATLSRDLGINLLTVAKWRKRQTVDDLQLGLGRSFVIKVAAHAVSPSRNSSKLSHCIN